MDAHKILHLDLHTTTALTLHRALEGHRLVSTGSSFGYYLLPDLDYDHRGRHPKTILDIPHLPFVLGVNRRLFSPKTFDLHLMDDILGERRASLVAPERLIVGANIGQPLLEDPKHRFGIFNLPPGLPLSQHFAAYRRDCEAQDEVMSMQERNRVNAKASVLMMEELMALGNKDDKTNPFIPLYRLAYDLAYLGYDPDMHIQNIFFDRKSGTLSLVHQLSEHIAAYSLHDQTAIRHALDLQLFRASCDFRVDFSSKDEDHSHYDHVYDQFKGYLDCAKEHVLKEHANHMEASILAFGNIRDVKAVSTKQPTFALLTELQHARHGKPAGRF